MIEHASIRILRPKTSALTEVALIERAHVLAAEVAAHAHEINSASKLPDDLIDKLASSGLLATLVPKVYGGHELGLDTAASIIKPFAAACPSVAWVLAFYIGHNWIHCQFPEQAQLEIFANGPSPRSAGVLAPTLKLKGVEGGYRLSGRNSWNSGSPHADFIMSAGIVTEGAKFPGPVIFIVPRSEVELVDTWQVEGMRATGSWDAVFDDVFIPEYRSMSAGGLLAGKTPGSSVHANTFYTRPLQLMTYGYCMPIFSGALRGVADEFIKLTRTRVGTNDSKAAAMKPTAQMRAARGEARAQMADTLVDEMVMSIMAPDATELYDPPARHGLKARGAMIAELCTSAINDLVLGAGANAFREESRLGMIYRDINMISVHAFFEKDAATEGYGRLLLGLENDGPV